MSNNNWDALPEELLAEKRWISFDAEKRGEEGWNDPKNWKMFTVLKNDSKCAWGGYMLDPSNTIAVLDADHVLDANGRPLQEIAGDLKNMMDELLHYGPTYYERSKSGSGYHMLYKLDPEQIQMQGIRHIYLTDKGAAGPKLELWFQTMHGFILTGNTMPGSVQQVLEGQRANDAWNYMLSKCNDKEPTTAENAPDTGIYGKDDEGHSIRKNPIHLNINRDELIQFINQLNPDMEYLDWVHVGMAIQNEGLPFKVWENWSNTGEKAADNKPGELEETWESFIRTGSNWNAGTLYKMRLNKNIWRGSLTADGQPVDANGEIIEVFNDQKNSDSTPIVVLDLELTKNGKVKNTINNYATILERDEMLKGHIGFNSFNGKPAARGNLPWKRSTDPTQFIRDWTDADDANCQRYIENCYGIQNDQKYQKGRVIVSANNKFNPVITMLEELEKQPGIDGTAHIDKLLPYYLGAEDSQYTRDVMRLTLLGAIQRVYYADKYGRGIKFDWMPLLVGAQGVGKSTFCRMLAINDDWYSDSLSTLDNKDTVLGICGKLIVEWGELEAIRRAKEVTQVKQFLSKKEDIIRIPYARYAVTMPRTCVFMGTTNDRTCLTDTTGNRRFWPLILSKARQQKHVLDDKAQTMEDIKLAWGEAMRIFKSMPDWTKELDMPERSKKAAESLQHDVTAVDPWTELISEYLDSLDPGALVNVQLLYEYAIYITGYKSYADAKRKDGNRIATIMDNMTGWKNIGEHNIKLTNGKRTKRVCWEKL
jgi:predicted P-loop ATPase